MKFKGIVITVVLASGLLWFIIFTLFNWRRNQVEYTEKSVSTLSELILDESIVDVALARQKNKESELWF